MKNLSKKQCEINYWVFCLFACLFVCHPTISISFLTHTETSPLPVKGCKFWPVLDTDGHWAARVSMLATLYVTRDILFSCHLRWPVTHTPVAERFAEELSLPVFTSYIFRCWDSNNQHSYAGRTHCTTAINRNPKIIVER